MPAHGELIAADTALLDKAKALLAIVRAEIDEQAFHRALASIWEVVAEANPARRDTVLWVLAEAIRRITLLVQPFMPQSTARILDQLAVLPEGRVFAAFDQGLVPGTVLPKPQGVFPRYVEPKAAA